VNPWLKRQVSPLIFSTDQATEYMNKIEISAEIIHRFSAETTLPPNQGIQKYAV
jgi:hypothetical protein